MRQVLRKRARRYYNIIRMMLYLLCLANFYFYSSEVEALEITTCKSGAVTPASFVISDCESSPCTLRKGTTKTIAIEFTADDNHQDAVLSLTATYMGQTRSYPGFDGKNACSGIYSLPDNVQVGCPIEKGKMYKYEFKLSLKLPMPTVTVPAKLALKDKTTKKDFVCTETNFALKS